MNIWGWVPWGRKQRQTRRGKTDFSWAKCGEREKHTKQPNCHRWKILCFWRRQVCGGKPSINLKEDIIKNYNGLPTRRVHWPAHAVIHPQSVLLKCTLSNCLRWGRHTALEKAANRVIRLTEANPTQSFQAPTWVTVSETASLLGAMF